MEGSGFGGLRVLGCLGPMSAHAPVAKAICGDVRADARGSVSTPQ